MPAARLSRTPDGYHRGVVDRGGAPATDRVSDVWGARTPYAPEEPWPERVDQHLRDGIGPDDVERWVRSACVLCSYGCGLEIAVRGDEIVGVRGDPADRVNRGRLGPKGLLGWQGQLRDRLTTPLVRRAGRLTETTWDEAMGLVVERSQSLLSSKGPLSHGFYTSGQLMLEEYYTLAVIGKAGIGTPHMDGNTRLCTATAAASLKESFGTDGQPGSYADLDLCDAVFHFGHNVAATQTVMWARMLDRLDASDPPRHVTVDPRRTRVAECSDVHLAVRPGTNLALVNGLLQQVIVNGWVDDAFVAAHTKGFEEMERVVSEYPPDVVADLCDVRRRRGGGGDLRHVEARRLHGPAGLLPGTPGDRGGRRGERPAPGSRPARPARLRHPPDERAADRAEQPGDRRGRRPARIPELGQPASRGRARAALGRGPDDDPALGAPTHALQMFRYAEQGSIGFLWIAGKSGGLVAGPGPGQADPG